MGPVGLRGCGRTARGIPGESAPAAWHETKRGAVKERFELTCWPCRMGRHDECPETIIVSGGEAVGPHTCACFLRHAKLALST